MSNTAIGSLYAIFAFFCMAIFGVLTKIALKDNPATWVSFIAYLTGTIALFPFVIRQGSNYLKSQHYQNLIGRALFGTAASFLYTISIHYIPIVNATLLFNTAPIFIPFLSMLFLRAKIAKNIWLAVALGFVGIIIIIKPTTAIFTQTGNLIALASGVSLAVAYFLMNLLASTDPRVRIIFYYLGIGTLLQIPLLLFTTPLSWNEGIFYASLSGLALLIAQIALIQGYKYAAVSQIGVYQYSSVVFIGLIDWWIWKQVPTSLEMLGILLVALAGIVIIWQGGRTARQ